MYNILIISHEFPPAIGGAGSVAQTLATVLSEDNNVTVFCKYSNKRIINNNYQIIQVKTPPLIFPIFYWIKIKKFLKTNKIDKIIINDIGAAQVASFFFSKEMMTKSYLYFHGNELEVILASNNLNFKLFNANYLKLINHVNKLIFVSNFLKKKILAKLDINDSLKKKSSIIYNSIDTNIFCPVKSQVFDSIRNVPNTKILLTVTRVVEKKGLNDIVKLLNLMKIRGIDNYHWVLIGDGAYLDQVFKSLSKHNLMDNFSYFTSVKREKLKEYYSAADIFILLSDFEESFGLVYLEANACGIPVIGKDKGGVNEAISDGISGYIVKNIDEAVEKIILINTENITDTNMYLNHVSKFTPNYMRREVEKLIANK